MSGKDIAFPFNPASAERPEAGLLTAAAPFGWALVRRWFLTRTAPTSAATMIIATCEASSIFWANLFMLPPCRQQQASNSLRYPCLIACLACLLAAADLFRELFSVQYRASSRYIVLSRDTRRVISFYAQDRHLAGLQYGDS